MVAPNIEYVEYDIRIRAREAITELERLTTSSTSFKNRIDLVQNSIRQFSKDTGMSLKSAKSYFQEMDRILAAPGQKSALFGNLAKQGWADVDKAMGTGVNNILSHFNVIRVAAGVLTAALVSGLFQAITQFFKSAISQAKQFETTLYRLSNAERQLSLAGLEVSLKGLKEGITDIQKALPIFSKEDVSELIGSLAVSTKELGFNEEQISNLD